MNTRNLVTRREFLRVSVFGPVSAALLSACGPAQPPATSAPPATAVPAATSAPEATAVPEPTQAPATPAPAEAVKLTMITPYGTWAEGELTRVFENYTKLNPSVTFDTPIWGESEQQGYVEVLMTRVAAGNPPDLGILWDSPCALGVRGALTVLDELNALSKYNGNENWPANLYKSCQWRGKSYGYPSFNAVYTLMYNQDAFAEAGLSTAREDFFKHWDEWRAAAAKFNKWEGDKLVKHGYIPLWHHFGYMWFELGGGTAYDDLNYRYLLDDEKNVEVLNYAVSWIDEQFKGSLEQALASGCSFVDIQSGEPCFQNGTSIMQHGGNFMMGMYKAENAPKFKWDCAPFPTALGGKEVTTVWPNWTAIPTGAKHLNEAFAFLDWYNGEGVEYWSMTQPDMPGNRKFKPDFLPEIMVKYRGEEDTKRLMKFFRGYQENSVNFWGSPVQTFASDQVFRAVEAVLKKAAEPMAALKEAQQASQAELDKVVQGNQ